MIRITQLLRRRAGMTLEGFQSHWLREHGPLAAGLAGRMQCLRHVQVHTLAESLAPQPPDPRRGVMEQPAYDGVAEYWFENIDALAAPATQAALATLHEAERAFVDLPGSPLWLAYEYPQVNPSPENIVANERSTLTKFYYPLRQPAGMSMDAAQLYWRTQHGPVIRRQAGTRILRYVQVHRFEHPLEAQWRAARGVTVESYMGHAELWFDRSLRSTDVPEQRASAVRAAEDEAKFIDFARSCRWHGKEHVFVNHM
jgi:hypothetical protein